MNLSLPRLDPAWVSPVARVGYATKGVVYILIGGLAVLTAVGEGGKVAGSEGAVRTIGHQPFGRVLLIAAAVGLAAYACWRFIQAIYGRRDDHGAWGAAKRVGCAISGLLHGSLAWFAFQLARGEPARGESGSRAALIRELDHPLGRIAIAAVGLGLLGHGIYQIVCGVRGKLPDELGGPGLSQGQERWMIVTGRIGLVARGIVFGVIGVGLVAAAQHRSSRSPRDIGSALRELASQPYGDLLLGAVAAGLAAYGASMLIAGLCARLASRGP